MQRLQRFEELMGEFRHLARMRNLDSVAACHLLYETALIRIQHGQLAAGASGGQVGYDAVSNAGRGVMQRGMVEQLQNPQKYGRAGDYQLSPFGSDALNLTPA